LSVSLAAVIADFLRIKPYKQAERKIVWRGAKVLLQLLPEAVGEERIQWCFGWVRRVAAS